MQQLPKLNQKTYTAILPVSQIEITYTPYTVAQEKAIIQTIEQEGKNSKDKILQAFFNLLQKTIIEPKDFDIKSISMIDFVFILIHTRAVSKGENVTIPYKCPKCDFQSTYERDIIKAVSIFNEGKSSIFHKIDEKYTIEIIPTPANFILQAALESDKKSKKKDDKIVVTNDDILAYSIKTLNYDGTVYSDFTIRDLHASVVGQMSENQILKALAKLDELTYITMKFDFECEKCKTKETIDIEDPMDFLYSSSTTNS